MKVIELKARNIKRIQAVDITPTDNMVVISGRNEQGKTSVLDSIWMALGGAAAAKDTPAPIRKGEKEAEVIVDLGKYKVTRTWTEKGSYLKVESPDGARYPSPQALLDDLRGEYTFDLLDFSKAKPVDQKKILMNLTGLQNTLTAIDKEKSNIYAERTMANRELQSAKNILDSMPVPPEDTPEKQVDIKDILAQQAEAQQATLELERMANNIESFRMIEKNGARRLEELSMYPQAIQNKYQGEKEQAERIYQEAVAMAERVRTETLRGCELSRDAAIASVEENIALVKKDIAEAITKGDELAKMYDTTAPQLPPAYYQQKVDEAEAINEHVRQRQAREHQVGYVQEKQKESDRLSMVLKKLEEDKDTIISQANFPIPNLGFDDNGVTYKGVPFIQCSSAERLRVSLAIAMALNPKVKVLRITDGSLLDADNLRIISEMIHEKDYQLWCERVSDNGGVGIVIEDGTVKTSA